MTSEAPERIWLQHDPNDEACGEMPDDWTIEGITWCWHRIGESDVEYIRADLSPQWRPISEAPMDGTWLMLYCPHPECTRVDVTHWVAHWVQSVGGWTDQGDSVVAWADDATHFMPLPEAPK